MTTSYGTSAPGGGYFDHASERNPEVVALEKRNAQLEELLAAQQNQVQTARAEAVEQLRREADASSDYSRRVSETLAQVEKHMTGDDIKELYRKNGL